MFGHHHLKNKAYLTANASVESLEESYRFVCNLLLNNKADNNTLTFIFLLEKKYEKIIDQFENNYMPFISLLKELSTAHDPEIVKNTSAKLNAMLEYKYNVQDLDPAKRDELTTFFDSFIENINPSKNERDLLTDFYKNYLSRIKKLKSSQRLLSLVNIHLNDDLSSIKEKLAAEIDAKRNAPHHHIKDAKFLKDLNNLYQLSLCETATNQMVDIEGNEIGEDLLKLSIKCAKQKPEPLQEKIKNAESFLEKNRYGLTFAINYKEVDDYIRDTYDPIIELCNYLSLHEQQSALSPSPIIHRFINKLIAEKEEKIHSYQEKNALMTESKKNAYETKLRHIEDLIAFLQGFRDNTIRLTVPERLLFKKIATTYRERKLEIVDHPIIAKENLFSDSQLKKAKLKTHLNELSPVDRSKDYRAYARRGKIDETREAIKQLKNHPNTNNDSKTLKIVDDVNKLAKFDSLLNKMMRDRDWASDYGSNQKASSIEDELYKTCETIRNSKAKKARKKRIQKKSSIAEMSLFNTNTSDNNPKNKVPRSTSVKSDPHSIHSDEKGPKKNKI